MEIATGLRPSQRGLLRRFAPRNDGGFAMTTCDGFDIRTRTWPLDRVHGLRPLGDALHLGRTAGPAGPSVAWLATETTGLARSLGPCVWLLGVAATSDGWLRLTQ